MTSTWRRLIGPLQGAGVRAIAIAIVLALGVASALVRGGPRTAIGEADDPLRAVTPARLAPGASVADGGSSGAGDGDTGETTADGREPSQVLSPEREPRLPPLVQGQLVVRFHAGITPAERRDARRAVGAKLIRPLRLPGAELVRIPGSLSVEAAAAAFERRPEVAYAEGNYLYGAFATPNDPGFPQLWGLSNTGQSVLGLAGTAGADIGGPAAWDWTTGDPAVTVAVVDTGVAADHPDLAPNVWRNAAEQSNGDDDDGNRLIDDIQGWDWVDDDNVPLDFHGHGTHVAGTIAAVGGDGTGVAGVAWHTRIMPLRVLDAAGAGTSADIAEAFTYAGSMGADIVNASLGGPSFSQAVSDAIRGAPGTLFVVAAGNGGSDGVGDDNDRTPTYPCNYDAPNILCVAASDQNDRLTSFSNYGATSVDLAAPGRSILSDQPAYGSPIWSEDFGAPLEARWTVGGSNSSWDRVEQPYAAAPGSLADSPAGPYSNATTTWATTHAALDLSGRHGCRLEMRLRLETEPVNDVLWVQLSQAPTGPWTTVAAWSGSTGGSFRRMIVDISRFDGSTGVLLRLGLTSNASVTADGAFIDDVSASCLVTPTGSNLAYLSGTSMATPHVAGAAALFMAQLPTASVSSVRDVLMRTAEPMPSLTGMTAVGGRLDIAAALDTDPPSSVQVSTPPMPFVFQPTFDVSWSASDGETGVASFDVAYREAASPSGFSEPVSWQRETTATSAPFAASAGATYCFSAVARDRVTPPNVSAPSPEACLSVPLDDRALSPAGTWQRRTGLAYYQTTFSEATGRGASLSASVRAKQVGVIATVCRKCGKVQVYFEGALLGELNFASPATRVKRVFLLPPFPEARTGTVELRVISNNRRVVIDGLGVSAV